MTWRRRRRSSGRTPGRLAHAAGSTLRSGSRRPGGAGHAAAIATVTRDGHRPTMPGRQLDDLGVIHDRLPRGRGVSLGLRGSLGDPPDSTRTDQP